MAVKKKGLGKGLDSLIPEKSNKPLAKEPAEEKRESESGSGIQMMKINMVEPNRDQPRKKFDEDAILELADSIKPISTISCSVYSFTITGTSLTPACLAALQRLSPAIIS